MGICIISTVWGLFCSGLPVQLSSGAGHGASAGESIRLTVDLQHHRSLHRVADAVDGLAAVDARILDDGVVYDEAGSRRLRVERHPLGGQDALALGVVPLQPHRLANSWEKEKSGT